MSARHLFDADVRELQDLFDRGDVDAAVQWIFDRFGEPLLAYYYSATRSEPDAEDLLQDLFLLILRKSRHLEPALIHDFGGELKDLRRLVFKWARRELLRVLRRQRAAIRGGGRTQVSLSVVSELGVEPVAGAVSERRVQVAIDSLSESHRAAIQYRIQGLSYAHIASLMGGTIARVTSLVRRAKENLRAALDRSK